MSPDLNALEAQRADAQVRLDGLKSQRQRNELGQFATPPLLAEQMAEYVCEVWKDRADRIRFLDPALGSGSLYSALLRVSPPALIERGMGVELDEGFAESAEHLWGSSGLQVVRGDFTKITVPDEANRPNLILTNPPYVRHHHLDAETKARLRRLSGDILDAEVNGLAGLYCYFMLLAHAWLADNGIGLWLVPSEFMGVKYGEALRYYLCSKVTLLGIHRFDPEDLQFGDALVSSAIVTFRKARPGPDHRAVLSYGSSLLTPRLKEAIPVSELKDTRKWTSLPNRRLHSAAPRSSRGVTLSALFTIKRGIATGANRFFVMTRQEAVARGITDRFLKPILPSPRYLSADMIEGDSLGYPAIAHPLSLIDSDVPEDQVKHVCRPLWEYLQEGVRSGLREKYLISRRNPWYKQEQRAPSPFLCTYMGRANRRRPFRFLWNKSQATAPNVYLLLYPIGSLKDALKSDPERGRVVFDLLRQIDDESLVHEGRVYGGGLYKLEPKELGRIDAAPFIEGLGLKVESPTEQGSLALSF